MARLTPELVEQIKLEAGFFDSDVLSGWEAGLLGRERVGRTLLLRRAPDHLTGQRYVNWLIGRDAAMRFVARRVRKVHFCGRSADGEIKVVRNSWGVKRGTILANMEKQGARGDVDVFYFENGNLIRHVKCGI